MDNSDCDIKSRSCNCSNLDEVNQKLREQQAQIDELTRTVQELLSIQKQKTRSDSCPESELKLSQGSQTSCGSSRSPSPDGTPLPETSLESQSDQFIYVLCADPDKRDHIDDHVQSNTVAILKQIEAVNQVAKSTDDTVALQMAATGEAMLEILQKQQGEINELKRELIRRSSRDSSLESSVTHKTYYTINDNSDRRFQFNIGSFTVPWFSSAPPVASIPGPPVASIPGPEKVASCLPALK